MSSTKEKITDWVPKNSHDGEFRRKPSSFRNQISPSPNADFPAERDRYHLYVSLACPWAHRTLIVRELKGLQDIIPVTYVSWHMGPKGWRFATSEEEDQYPAGPDPLYGSKLLSELYFKAQEGYEGRYTVPTLWDRKKETIVNNESAEIIRMFYTAFDGLVEEKYRGEFLYPEELKGDIDGINEWVYDTVNNGVYKSGFATTQSAYETNCTTLFSSLDRLESILSSSSGPYLLGTALTEADIRLYTTIIRFDVVYVQHFKCNIRDIRSGYPALHKWLRHLYWEVKGFKETTDFAHIKKHYTKSHPQINPHGITPLGPLPDILPVDGK